MISTIINQSQGNAAKMDIVIAMPEPGRLFFFGKGCSVFNGYPHRGQAFALSDTSPLHSGHFNKAMLSSFFCFKY
jgi:hypothetical protein